MIKKKKTLTRTSGKKGFVTRYNDREAKGNIGNTALKTLVDAVTGAIVGAGVGAIAGQYAVIIGPVLMGVGHFSGDKSGVIRVAGASAMAYGIAKAIENQSVSGLGAAGDVKNRMVNLKDELFVAFYLDKVFTGNGSASTPAIASSDAAVGAIDLSALDMFEEFNQQEADEFSLSQGYDPELPEFTMDDYPTSSPDFSFAVIDDPDLTDL